MSYEDRILEDPEIQSRLIEVGIGDRLALSALEEFDGFQKLKEKAEAFGGKASEALAKKILRGEDVPKEEIAFMRGYIKGMEAITGYPERVERDFNSTAMKVHERLESMNPGGSDE